MGTVRCTTTTTTNTNTTTTTTTTNTTSSSRVVVGMGPNCINYSNFSSRVHIIFPIV